MLLENFLESIESLPVDTKRNLTLIGELDKRACEAVEDAKRKADKYLEQVHTLAPSERNKHVDEMNKRFQDAIELTEQKQAVALQTYQLIDKHIRRLDANLAAIVQELDEDQASACSSEKRTSKGQGTSSSAKQRASSNRTTNSRKRPLNESVKSQSRRGRKPKRKRLDEVTDDGDTTTKKDRESGDGASSDDDLSRLRSIPAAAKLALRVGQKPEELLLAVDPNEPVYCICKRVSYGEMIACDNPDCTTEWYHLDCVDLKVIPRGKWFCPTCRNDRDAR